MNAAMDIRKEMAALGWHSEDRLSNEGWGDKVGFSIWFRRWDWHGRRILGNYACFHYHTGDLTQIDAAVAKAAEISRDAWERFPDVVPSLNAMGELKPDLLLVLK